jgi:hypothetical protein
LSAFAFASLGFAFDARRTELAETAGFPLLDM